MFTAFLVTVGLTAAQPRTVPREYAHLPPIYWVPYLYKPIPMFGEGRQEHVEYIERMARLKREAEERAEPRQPVLPLLKWKAEEPKRPEVPNVARAPTKRDLLNEEIRDLTNSIALLNAIGSEKHAATIQRLRESVVKLRTELKECTRPADHVGVRDGVRSWVFQGVVKA